MCIMCMCTCLHLISCSHKYTYLMLQEQHRTGSQTRSERHPNPYIPVDMCSVLFVYARVYVLIQVWTRTKICTRFIHVQGNGKSIDQHDNACTHSQTNTYMWHTTQIHQQDTRMRRSVQMHALRRHCRCTHSENVDKLVIPTGQLFGIGTRAHSNRNPPNCSHTILHDLSAAHGDGVWALITPEGQSVESWKYQPSSCCCGIRISFGVPSREMSHSRRVPRCNRTRTARPQTFGITPTEKINMIIKELSLTDRIGVVIGELSLSAPLRDSNGK